MGSPLTFHCTVVSSITPAFVSFARCTRVESRFIMMFQARHHRFLKQRDFQHIQHKSKRPSSLRPKVE